MPWPGTDLVMGREGLKPSYRRAANPTELSYSSSKNSRYGSLNERLKVEDEDFSPPR